MRVYVRNLGGTPIIIDAAATPIVTADIGDGQVTNAKLADMAAGTIKGRALGIGTGPPQDLAAGQLPGTQTNDNAAAGNVAEYIECSATGGSATVTITNASPAVVSWTNHRLSAGACVNFTTTGALPTGLAVGTNYYVSITGLAANSFSVSTSVDNALAGTNVNTSSAGSGTHTGRNTVVLATGVPVNAAGIPLTAGDWSIFARGFFLPDATTVMSNPTLASVSATSGTLDLSSLFRALAVACPQAGNTGGGGYNAVIPPARFLLSAPTTIYLVVQSSFTTANMQGGGMLAASRRR